MVKKRNYVNNKDLTEAIVDYQKLCRKHARAGLPEPTMPRYIGECIHSICNRLTQGFGFSFGGYSWHDEMILDAIERCVYAVRKFNHKKATSGAFSYLTTVAIHAKKKRLKDEKKQNAIKHKWFVAQQYNRSELEGKEPTEVSEEIIQNYDEMGKNKKILTRYRKPFKVNNKGKQYEKL